MKPIPAMCAVLLALFASLGVGAGEVDIARPDQWQRWPQDKVKVEKSGDAIHIEQLNAGGHFTFPIKKADAHLRSVSFRLKAAPDNRFDTVDFGVVDADGEYYFKQIPILPDWTDCHFTMDQLKLYQYGGAKIVDGVLSPDQVQSIRFGCWPAGRSFLVSGLRLSYAESTPDGLLIERPDLNRVDWEKWPGNGEVLAAVNNDNRPVRIEFVKKGGVTMPVPRIGGREFVEAKFSARSADGKPCEQEVLFIESSGETWYALVNFTAEWQAFAFNADTLKFFPYGGAKKVNGVFDPGTVQKLRFNGFGEPHAFELKDMALAYRKADKPEEQPVVDNYVFKPVPWTETPSEDFRKDYPDARNLTIRNNVFLKDGRPTFVLGGWQGLWDGRPWLMQLSGVDVLTYNATELYSLYEPKRLPDGKVQAGYVDNPWYESVIRRWLDAGILMWHEHKAHPGRHMFSKFPEFKDLLGGGHFVVYDPFHPRADEAYLELYKSFMQHTRKYPLFCYELFNEMNYDNPHLSSRKVFRETMKAKYGDIQRANAVWNTTFADFDHANPPGYIQDDGRNESLPREPLTEREGRQYPNLKIDWMKFQEERSYQAIERLMPVMRKLDPDPKTFSTIQSHLCLWMDYNHSNLKPEALVDFSDFYAHEVGVTYPESGSYASFGQVARVLRPFLTSDLVRAFCPDKPIINAEGPLNVKAAGADAKSLVETDLVGLHGGWRFHDATAAEPDGWQAPAFADGQWSAIKVPAMWGEDGHPQCQVGLYRRRFTWDRPAGTPYFLNGKGFADTADLYLNGEKLGTVTGFDTGFTFDATPHLRAGENVFAVKIVNRYFHGGMYYGGIRGFVALNDAALIPSVNAQVEERHLRSYFLTQAVRGTAGTALCYDHPYEQMATKFIAKSKAEADSLMPILFAPGAAPQAKLAMVYPLEWLRGVSHKDYIELIEGPGTADCMPYYAAALFHGAGRVDAVRNQYLLDHDLSQYEALLMPADIRASSAVVDRLERYVRAGGKLIMEYGSLTVDDDTHQPLDASKLTGVRVTGYDAEPAEYDHPALGRGKNTLRFGDKTARARLEPVGATVAAAYRDGKPLLLKHTLGQGAVYYVNGTFPADKSLALIGGLLRDLDVSRRFTLAGIGGQPAPGMTEMFLFTDPENRSVFYLQNFGTDAAAKVAIADVKAGRYRVRNAAKGNVVSSPSGKGFWTAEEFADGFAVQTRRFDPVVLLLEPADAPAYPLRGIAPTRRQMLGELWVDAPPVEGQPVIAVAPSELDFYGLMPTAWRLLSDSRFTLQRYVPGQSLDGIAALVWSDASRRAKNLDEIEQYVKNGGTLVYCDKAPLNWHAISHNPELLNRFGLKSGRLRSDVLYASTPVPPPGDAMRVECRDFAKHPVAEQVDAFVTASAGVLAGYPENAKVLLAAPAGTTVAGKPLLAEVPFGKGRVIWLGDMDAMHPLGFERGGNAQLWLNIFNHAVGRPIVKLAPEVRGKALFLTAEKLKQAAREESAGRTTFDTPELAPLYLGKFNPDSLKGMSSKDPIVDALKQAF